MANQAAVEAVAGVVRERTGLVFPPSRREGIALSIHRAMDRARLSDPERYRDLIASDGRALDDLVGELTVGETYFFREPAQFDWLGDEALPEIRRRCGPGHGIRAWSSGCASGEEAYSLAILFDQEGLGEAAHVLATDISRTALAKARQAVYGPWSLRGLEVRPRNSPVLRDSGGERLSAYLRQQFAVEERIRRRVHFAYLNLALDRYPSFTNGTWGMDLILCRNVLIYLDPQTVRTVARRLFDCLAPGGWLLTASTDPPLGGELPSAAVSTRAGLFYRRPPASASPAPEVQEPHAAEAQPVGEIESPSPASPPARSDRVPIVGPVTTDAPSQGRAASPGGGGVSACVQEVRSLANVDAGRAADHCAAAVARHPLSAELHYLHAVLLLDQGRHDEAVQAARHVLYLDRTLAVGHFVLGSIFRRLGDHEAAWRAFRNARDLCRAQPADAVVPLADGERAGRLAEAAADRLAVLVATGEARP